MLENKPVQSSKKRKWQAPQVTSLNSEETESGVTTFNPETLTVTAVS